MTILWEQNSQPSAGELRTVLVTRVSGTLKDNCFCFKNILVTWQGRTRCAVWGGVPYPAPTGVVDLFE